MKALLGVVVQCCTLGHWHLFMKQTGPAKLLPCMKLSVNVHSE